MLHTQNQAGKSPPQPMDNPEQDKVPPQAREQQLDAMIPPRPPRCDGDNSGGSSNNNRKCNNNNNNCNCSKNNNNNSGDSNCSGDSNISSSNNRGNNNRSSNCSGDSNISSSNNNNNVRSSNSGNNNRNSSNSNCSGDSNISSSNNGNSSNDSSNNNRNSSNNSSNSISNIGSNNISNSSNNNRNNISNNISNSSNNNRNNISNNNSNFSNNSSTISSNNSSNRNNNSNIIYSLRLGPRAAMLVSVHPEFSEEEQQLQDLTGAEDIVPTKWCISTLLLHNGQYYRNIIHNFIPSPELMVNLDQRLLNLVRPVALVRQPVLPLNVFHMVRFYSQQLISAATNLEGIFARETLLPSIVWTMRHTSQSLQSMLYEIEHSLFAMEDPRRVEARINSARAGHNGEILYDADDGSDVTDTSSEAESESSCEICMQELASNCSLNRELLRRLHSYDSTSESSDEESERRGLGYRIVDYDEIPQQYWSLTSSDDENDNEEELGDEESWESWQTDFEDDDSFDAYMVGLLRGRQGRWVARQSTLFLEWDAGSCGSNDEYEELRSMLTDSSDVDPDAWQYNEDRSFETELSRPLRRLIGEIPAQTALEERQSWHHFVQLCDGAYSACDTSSGSGHSSLDDALSSHHSPTCSCAFHGRGGDRAASPIPYWETNERFEPRHIWDHVYAINPNARINSLQQTIRAMMVANHSRLQSTDTESGSDLDSEYNPRDELEMEFDFRVRDFRERERRTLDSDMEVDIDHDMSMDLDNDTQQEQIVPLASFLKETDELIAKIKASL